MARRAAIALPGSSAPKTAEPATNVSAPASSGLLDRRGGDAAVDLQPDRRAAAAGLVGQAAELRHGLGHERLPAEAGLDRHHEDLVEVVEEVEQPLDRGRRLDGDARPRTDRAQAPGEGDRLGGGLEVEGDRCGAELGVLRRPAVGVGDHQVHVERNRAGRLDALDHLRPEGQVGHEVVVHDIHVHEVRGGDAGEVGLHVHEVRGEHARD